jgi:hypothetical protein
MMAMAIFTIISLIMMQFFNSAQQIWSKASQRNEIYSDARVALDLIARDLQCALYNNDTTAGSRKGIYPFWFQDVKLVNNATYYSDDNIQWTMLNFITATSAKPTSASSSICELRYTFVPIGEIFKNPDGSLIDGGWLVRSCTGDGGNAKAYDATVRYNAGDLVTSVSDIYISMNGVNNIGNAPPSATWWALYTTYNFENWYRTTNDPLRTARIWIRQDATSSNPNDASNQPPILTMSNSSHEVFQKVIPHVYELKFTCYRYDPVTFSLVMFNPLANADVWGTYFPAAVKIDIVLMAKSDWDRWTLTKENGDLSLAKRIRLQSQRTFSKTVYLNNKLSL